MSTSVFHSRYSTSPAITPDCEIPILMEAPTDHRRPSALSDKRLNNVNYVRHVLRRFFGGSARKSSPAVVFDDALCDQSPSSHLPADNCTSPVFVHPNLQYEKHAKFSGNALLSPANGV